VRRWTRDGAHRWRANTHQVASFRRVRRELGSGVGFGERPLCRDLEFRDSLSGCLDLGSDEKSGRCGDDESHHQHEEAKRDDQVSLAR